MEQPLVVNDVDDDERIKSKPEDVGAQSCVSKWITSSYIANFGVQYNYSNLSIALLFLSTGGKWYDGDMWGGNISSILKSSIFLGSIFGMMTMGYVGDMFGLKRGFTITSMIVVVFAFVSAFGPCGGDDQAMVILGVTRFFLGVGIGGNYPLSAAKSAEDAKAQNDRAGVQDDAGKNWAVGMCMVWQVLGSLMPYAVAMVVSPLGSSAAAAMWQFRILLALGAVPPLLVLASTYGEEESAAFKMRKEQRTRAGDSAALGNTTAEESKYREDDPLSSNKSTYNESGGEDHDNEDANLSWLGLVKHGFATDPRMARHLAATALCWLMYDIAYYGSNQFTPTMTAAVFGESDDDDAVIMTNSQHDIIGIAAGAPACLHALWALKWMGTKRLQVWGFVWIGAMCFFIAAFWVPLGGSNRADEADDDDDSADDDDSSDPTRSAILFTLYVLFTASTNWGPNMSTFVLPQEVFRPDVLATFNGIAAASGKTGAFLGVWIFESIYDWLGMIPLMLLVGGLNILGALISQTCISDELFKRQKEQAEQQATR